MNLVTRCLFAGALLMGSAVALVAQDAPYTLKTTTRLVVLDVVVLDKDGKPVRGLDKSAFSVLEDKKPQTIRNFEAHLPMPEGSAPPVVVNSTADLKKIGTAPVDVLVFDELNSKFEDMAYARDRMEKYIKAQPEVLPRPTQLLAAGDAHFVVLKDYTQSRTELLAALKSHLPQYPWQMMRNGSGDGALERMSQTLGILAQIADATNGTRGRKNVIWLGAGYPSLDTTAMDEEDQDKIGDVIKTVTERMLASHVVLYVVDPAGVHGMVQDTGTDDEGNLTTGDISSGLGPFTGKLDFASFAPATGGEVYGERNDLDRAVDEGLKESSVYYTLSYSPTNMDDVSTAFRKIQVKMADRGYHAVTRQGYFGGPMRVEAPPKPKEKTSNQLKWDMASAAQTSLAYNGLDVHVVTAPGGFQVNVLAKDLTWTDDADGSRDGELTIMAVCSTAKAKHVCQMSREVKERLKPGDDIEHGEKLGVGFKLDVPANTATVRFVVRDAGSGRIGTADFSTK